MPPIRLSLMPFTDEQEEILSLLNLFHPGIVLQFKPDTHFIFANFYEIRDRPPPTIKPRPFGADFQLVKYADGMTAFIDENDHWGGPLSYVFAFELLEMNVGSDPHHLAIKAYINTLPRGTRILLYWD